MSNNEPCMSVLSMGKPLFGKFKASLAFAGNEPFNPAAVLQFLNREHAIQVGDDAEFFLFAHFDAPFYLQYLALRNRTMPSRVLS